jgi:hypothetical protein
MPEVEDSESALALSYQLYEFPEEIEELEF